ncbi:hypothetical protein AU255_06890 [Methyloprofundus sedimenti]|uniref:Laminin G domain-containing protein n=1 Tax=Methyloprofundus sedimenti TaxID=1420851 RepID=A0A1V8M7P8_9GAMM|nr:LamG domain-containing protein [Methyloprofundus sedimenti]OQK17591.1 hypothetical protein AU255_06890 [Methyloprofundus sedimenti]
MDHLEGLNGPILYEDKPLRDFSLVFWLKLNPGEGGIVVSFDPTQWFEIEVLRSGNSSGHLVLTTVNSLGVIDRMESNELVANGQWRSITVTYNTSQSEQSIQIDQLDKQSKPTQSGLIGGRKTRSGYLGVSTFTAEFSDLQEVKGNFKGAITGLRFIRGQADSKQLKAIINPGNRPAFSLRQVAAPRFWQPKEPAVAIVGDDATSSDSFQTEDHYPHDLLRCTYIQGLSTDALLGNDKPASLKVIQSLRKTLDHIQQSKPDSFGYFEADGTSWNPLFAEWEVALYPLAISHLHNGKSSQYDPEFIYQGYQLPRESNELELMPEQCPLAQTASFLGGRSLISPNASAAMNVRLDEFINAHKGIVPKEFLDIQKNYLQQKRKC